MSIGHFQLATVAVGDGGDGETIPAASTADDAESLFYFWSALSRSLSLSLPQCATE